MKIGIIGVGVVGGALLKHFQIFQRDVVLYDTNGTGSFEEVVKSDFIFICVPTPSNPDGSCDTSIVEDTIRVISKKSKPTVVIKSTVIPGTTERIQNQYPELSIMYNPEFLTEATAEQNMLFPDRQIIGYTEKSYPYAQIVRSILPIANFTRIIPATEAEMVKYWGNSFYAIKVIFGNEIYDLCQKLGIDYDIVKECVVVDKYIGDNHWDVFHGGYRGYGGKCLPKDSKALIALGDKLGVSMDLSKTADKVNERLIKK